MDCINADSSQIKRFAYNNATRQLAVQFKDGAIYNYAAVPPEHFAGLKNAASKGKFLDSHINGKYTATRVEPLA